tara:strand:- start:331 stop:1608 length:1278 start_codon:yes stop_codon:yes gene_type:complete
MTISKIKIANIRVIIIFLALYVFYLIGFFLNEDSSGGAIADYSAYEPIIKSFALDFKYSFFNFDDFGERHSPVLIMLLSIFYKLNIDATIIRFVNLNISIISIFLFYKCLSFKFKNVENNYLILISAIFFLSPIFRSLNIWPDSRIYGFHFFILSTFFYLKFIYYEKKNYFCYLNIVFLAIASYFSPNFSLFSIFFLYQFYKHFKLSIEILNCIILNLVLALPAFYYLFILDIFFLANVGVNPTSDVVSKFGIPIEYNISNKILIISSIIFFYFIPIMIIKKNLFIYENKINSKNFFLLLVLFILPLMITFNYSLNITGGGIVLHLSNFLFKNNLLFYIISLFSVLVVFSLCKHNLNNFIIIMILFFSNPQLSIYHKYYDPLIFFLTFTLLSVRLNKSFFNYRNILIIYIFYIIFLILNLLKQFF